MVCALFSLGPCLAVVSVALVGFRLGGGDRASVAATPPAVEPLYLSDCAVCHGSGGKGTVRGPNLVGVGRASVDYELSTGRMPLAPPVRSDQSGRPLAPDPNRTLPNPTATVKRHHPAYSPDTIRQLVGYVGSFGSGGPDIPTLQPGDRAKGGESFRLQCAACHAWAANGGALSHREAPPLHQATPLQIAEAIRVGPGQMPAFGTAALTDHQVNNVVAYVRYLDKPRDRGGNPLGHLGPVTEGAVALAGIGLVLLFLRAIGQRG